MEKPVEKLLVTQEQWVQFMRKGENHMEVGGIDDFCPAFVHPDFLIYSLAVGAAAAVAGIIVEFHMPTVRALGNIDSELSGFTVQDRPGSFALGL